MEGNAAWIKVKNLISSGAKIDVADALSELTKHEIENTYEDGQNLLHHAIAKNNLEVARFLFEKECFLLPQLSETIPYLHVACFYGFKDMVDLLLKKRPNQEDVKVSAKDEQWKKFIAANSLRVKEKEDFLAKISSLERENEELSAYRIAALCLEEDCLHSLLTRHPQKYWLSRMVELGELDSLEFLLETRKYYYTVYQKQSALTDAFETSLLLILPQCLEVVLKYTNKHGICVYQRNPYHFLYTYGKFGFWTGKDPMAEMTRLLIHYGWDVNTMEEPASFPLYCILRHVKDYDDEIFHEEAPDVLQTLDEELACLSELLAAGANTNFDEKIYSGRVSQAIVKSDLESAVNQKIRKERTAFSSVAEALVALIYHKADLFLLEFVSQAGSLLKEYGCHLNGQRYWLAEVIRNDDDAGLKLLLRIMEFDLNCLNYGLEESLYHMAPRCLESLLQYAAENNVTFSQKDPLSFMYLSIVCKGSPAGKYAAECTRTLIRYGYSVKGMQTPASYPLYTLLWSVAAVNDSDMSYNSDTRRVPKRAIACLDILLAAGADPNFDETAILAPKSVMPVSAMEASVVRGIQSLRFMEIPGRTRKQYSSAGEVLMYMFDLCNSGLDFLNVVAKSATLLVQHGCDLSFRNGDGLTVLHIFMSNAAEAYDYYAMRVTENTEAREHLGKVMRCLLTEGADIYARDHSSKLPLTYFGDSFVQEFGIAVYDCDEDEDLLKAIPPLVTPFFKIMDLMEIKEAQEVVTEFVKAVDKNIIEDQEPDVEISMTVVEGLKNDVQSHLKVRSLFHSCLIKVWRYCGYKLTKTETLELPWNVKQHLNDMLSF